MARSPSSSRRWPFLVLALVSVAGIVYGYMGIVMAASLSGATTYPEPPGHATYWQSVARNWLLLVGISGAGLVTALTMLWRRRMRATQSGSGEQAA